MLAQPISRMTLFTGLFFGLTAPLIITFFLGIGIPVAFNLNLFLNAWIELLMIFISGFFMILIFTGLAFLFSTITDDKLKGLGAAIFTLLFLLIIYDGLILFLLEYFQDYPTENLALILSLFNPIDLGRILIVLKFDISALMGYTGAVFENFFGNNLGIIISLTLMLFWYIIPFLLGLRIFSKKDF
jgi:Cu-processing system permease protein